MKNNTLKYGMLVVGLLSVIAPLQAHRPGMNRKHYKHAVKHVAARNHCKTGCQRQGQRPAGRPVHRPVTRGAQRPAVHHARGHHQHNRPAVAHHHGRMQHNRAHVARRCAGQQCQMRRMQPRAHVAARVQAPVRMHRAPQRHVVRGCVNGSCRRVRPAAHGRHVQFNVRFGR